MGFVGACEEGGEEEPDGVLSGSLWEPGGGGRRTGLDYPPRFWEGAG